MQIAAEGGNALAQLKLACCYRDGHVIEKDQMKAIKWYKDAIAHGLTPLELQELQAEDNK